MRHIEYPSDKTPPKIWVEKAKALTEELKRATDKAARDKIIDDNAKVWRVITRWLARFSNNKCWFTEAHNTCCYWHVEHFRPKKKAKDPERDGYWWLAFDYRNYRLCGSVSNIKKGSCFPLRTGTTAASCPDDNCDDEAPLLIDPTIASDVMLLTFTFGGMAVPAEPDGWHNERARKSIERYELNDHKALSFARQTVWNQCKIDVERLERLMAEQKKKHSPSRNKEIDIIAQRLKDRTRFTSEFSSVAIAFFTQYPKPWARRFIA